MANPSPGHVGAHLVAAADALGVTYEVCDMQEAFAGAKPAQWAVWRLRDRRPLRLRSFSRQVVAACDRFDPDVVLTTGTAPLDHAALSELAGLVPHLVNYSCDDPWSSAVRASWYLDGLALYHTIYNPRRANFADFKAAGCDDVRYLPFGFSPSVHRPVVLSPAERARYGCDAVFVGGADPDRVPLMAALSRAGVTLKLYGRYWERFPDTRPFAQGTIAGDLVAHALAGAAVAPCLVRRSNRDGHSMRTFELAAMGACMVVEDTDEHREIFGDDGDSVRYFGSDDELVETVLALLKDEPARAALRARVRARMATGHSYDVRLRTMLDGDGTK